MCQEAHAVVHTCSGDETEAWACYLATFTENKARAHVHHRTSAQKCVQKPQP